MDKTGHPYETATSNTPKENPIERTIDATTKSVITTKYQSL